MKVQFNQVRQKVWMRNHNHIGTLIFLLIGLITQVPSELTGNLSYAEGRVKRSTNSSNQDGHEENSRYIFDVFHVCAYIFVIIFRR